jgi:hypothetical protein
MPAAQNYTRFQNYSDYQISHQLPGPALSGPDLNADFDRIKITTDALIANLNLIQRSDGLLNNLLVTPDTLSSAVLTMLAGWNPRGAWVTATGYAVKDMVTQAGNVYVCLVAHLAGTFATDLAALVWQLISTMGATGAPGPTGPAGASRAGFVNRLINGDHSIDQRNEGAAKTYVAAANVTYGVDRWYASCTGANVTGQRVAGTNINQFAYKFTGAPLNTGLVFGHRIEGVNVSDLINQVVTVQVWLSSSSITTVNWKTFSANTTDAWGTKTTSGTGTETAIDSGALTITPTPTLYSFQTNLGANAAKGIDLEFSCGPLLTLQTLQYESVQLEAGNVASPYDRQSFEVRLARCERYFEKSYDVGIVAGTATRNGAFATTSPGSGVMSTRYRAPKRAVPTVTAYSTFTGVAGNFYNISDSADGPAVFSNGGMKGIAINAVGVASPKFCEVHLTAEAEL